MVDGVRNVIEKWQSDERQTSLGEAKVQQVIVLPILRRLGWDPDNDREVYPQYPVADGWVDYALLISNAPKVFIEVKKGGEPLEKHQEQLLNYSFKQGVKLAALTNGVTWWFYLPLQEGSWEQRKFHAVEFDKQNGTEISQKFADLLSKENVSSGKAVQTAEDLYKRHQIAETLQEAWKQLVDGTIADLLSTKTLELCGHRPDKNEVDQFLTKVRFPHMMLHPSAPEPTPAPVFVPTPQPVSNPKLNHSTSSMKGKKLKAFTFNGYRHEVKTWISMLVKLCELVYSAHNDRFDEVLSLRVTPRRNPCFSRNSKDFPKFKPIDKTGIVVDSNKTADEIKVIAKNLISHFGYDKGDLSFDID